MIEPVLAWGGVRLPVVAHSATFSPAGTTVTFLERAVCPVCGEQCKRMELERLAVGRPIAYVGDGWSDRCAAKAADLVFARATLAEHLAEEGVAFVPFDDLLDVREGLRRYLRAGVAADDGAEPARDPVADLHLSGAVARRRGAEAAMSTSCVIASSRAVSIHSRIVAGSASKWNCVPHALRP